MDEALKKRDASMRPAQLTPENLGSPRRRPTRSWSFNEAGAINAGKPEKGDTLNVRVKKLQ